MHVNKLHINMEKCCFIHFKAGNKENAVNAEFDVKIVDEIIFYFIENFKIIIKKLYNNELKII